MNFFQQADIAVADLTVTAEREEAVDFTAPFLNGGVGILYSVSQKALDYKSVPSWRVDETIGNYRLVAKTYLILLSHHRIKSTFAEKEFLICTVTEFSPIKAELTMPKSISDFFKPFTSKIRYIG